MPTLLHVDASPRGDQSISRHLSAAFVEAWKAKNPDGQVVTRDLTKSALTFVDMEWIGGAYTPPEGQSPEQKKALAISDELIAELLSADELVLGTPMYNFGVPALVKAWIDHLVRNGKTFSSGPGGYEGLAKGRKATFVIASLGSYDAGSGAEGYNQESPYLQAIFGFMGIESKTVLAGGGSAVMFGGMPLDEFLKPLVEKVQASV